MNKIIAAHHPEMNLQQTADEANSELAVVFRFKGREDYQNTWLAMQQFTNARTDHTQDEIWLLEHPPVFTQGQNGKPEHILNPGEIPIVKTDRGGQVTYHGPGQLMVYTLINLKRKKFNVRQFVSALEQSVIDLLISFQINAYAKCDAPGVYVKTNDTCEKKICSIGLRVRRGCAYHGIAFNIAMDLSPFNRINPCGFAKLEMTQTLSLGGPTNVKSAAEDLSNYLMKNLRYTNANYFYDDQSETTWKQNTII